MILRPGAHSQFTLAQDSQIIVSVCHALAQVSLHGAFAFTTLTAVFSEDYELPAVAVHAVGAACCLALLWQVDILPASAALLSSATLHSIMSLLLICRHSGCDAAADGTCSIGACMQASAAGQMPPTLLRLSLAAAATSAAVNVQHFRGRSRPQLANPAAQRLRQWLRFLGCIGMGLLAQVHDQHTTVARMLNAHELSTLKA